MVTRQRIREYKSIWPDSTELSRDTIRRVSRFEYFTITFGPDDIYRAIPTDSFYWFEFMRVLLTVRVDVAKSL